jgi:hypothetical protein
LKEDLLSVRVHGDAIEDGVGGVGSPMTYWRPTGN